MSDCYEWLPGLDWHRLSPTRLSSFLWWTEHSTQQIYDAKSQREPRWLCWWCSWNRSLNCGGWNLWVLGILGHWGWLWACHFSHSICWDALCPASGAYAFVFALPHATVFVYHLSAKRDLSICLWCCHWHFQTPASAAACCLRNVSIP